jgi:vacuolar protein sorting-associated protein 51
MSDNPYNMDSSSFDADKYLNKLLKESSLQEIMDAEASIVKNVKNLHSDMQTLVYENYNKFISATDTIRKMKTDFNEMENEMNLLAAKMSSISTISETITGTLQDTRSQLTRLSGKHSLLKRLQFLSSLPTNLKKLIDAENYAQAITDYNYALNFLQQYGSQPSFKGIQEDIDSIIGGLKAKLKSDFQTTTTAQSLTEIGELLLQLGEKPSELAKDMLQSATRRLNEQIVMLQDQTSYPMDIDFIEFIDLGIDGFLQDLTLFVSAYHDMFLTGSKHLEQEADDFTERARDDLNVFVTKNMEKYLNLVQDRVEAETGQGDSQILLRALDRLHRRLSAMKNLCKDVDMTK